MPDLSANLPMGRSLRITLLASAVVLVSGASLFFAPDLLAGRWPWPLLPFNARFLGGVYLAELLAIAITLRVGRWAPARLTAGLAFTFTTAVTLASLVELGAFDPRRLSTYLWFLLYTGAAVSLGYHVWQQRNLAPALAAPLSPAWRRFLAIQAAILGLYAVGLLLAPRFAGSFWPWPLDAFHGRLYSAVFFSGAAGALILLRAAAPIETLVFGLAQAVLGGCAVVGLVLVDISLQRVAWLSAGTALWVGGFVVLAAAGLGMMWEAGVRLAWQSR